MPVYDWWVYIVFAIPGLVLFFMNWGIFIHNARGGKWISGVPLFGGLWIAVVCLISPYKWLAFIGLADPGIWQLGWALISEWLPKGKKKE